VLIYFLFVSDIFIYWMFQKFYSFFIVYQYLLVFRDNRPVESCTRVGEVKYMKHFLAVACSAALSKQCMVAIALAI